MTSATSATRTSTLVVGEQRGPVRDGPVAQPPDQRGLDLGDDHPAYARVGQHLGQREPETEPADQHAARRRRAAPAPRGPAPARSTSPGCPSRTPRWPAAPASSTRPVSVRCLQHELPALRLRPRHLHHTPILPTTSYESWSPGHDSYDVVGHPQGVGRHRATAGRLRSIAESGADHAVRRVDSMRRVRDAGVRDQGGVVSRRQLYALGVTRWRYVANVRARRWRRIGRPVDLRPHRADDARRQTGGRRCSRAGPRAFLDGASALEAAGLEHSRAAGSGSRCRAAPGCAATAATTSGRRGGGPPTTWRLRDPPQPAGGRGDQGGPLGRDGPAGDATCSP